VTFKRDDGHRQALRIVGEDEADPRKRRRRRECLHARSVAGKYQLLLVYRRGWVFVLPVLYYLRRHRLWMIPVDAAVKAPTGYAEFPREMLRPPRSLAKKMFVDIQRWTVMKKGGHSAAMETKALADDIQAFFRPLRK
jgi:hypothetical protein